jgi:hypothetical protein
MMEELKPYIPAIVTFISGGLAGAILNALLTRRRQKVDATLKILDGYFDRFDDMAVCYRLLNENPFQDTPDNLNNVKKVGDWFETVANMADAKLIDGEMLLDGFGFRSQIERFRTSVNGSDLFRPFLANQWSTLRDFK